MAQATSVPVGIMYNPATASDPNYIAKMMQAQRQQKLADALMGPATSNIEYDPKGKISPLQGLSKMLAAALSGYEGNQAMNSQAQLMAQNNQAMRNFVARRNGGQASQPSNLPNFPNQQPDPSKIGQALMSQGTSATGNTGSLNPFDDDPDLIVSAMNGNWAAQKAYETILQNHRLTDEAKNLGGPDRPVFLNKFSKEGNSDTQQLINERDRYAQGSPDYSRLQQALTKNTNIPPILAKGGDFIVNPTTFDWSQQLPNENGNYMANINGNTPTALTVPGQAQNQATAQGIIERAKQQNTFVKDVPGANGAQSGFVGDLSTQAQQGAAPQGAAPASNIVQGPSISDAGIQKNGGDFIAQLPQHATQAMQVRRSLEGALDALQNTKTGPGMQTTYKISALLKNMGLDVSPSATENFQTLSKQLNNALSNSAAINGNTGSDARMDQFMHGQPAADTMNKAPLDKAIRYVLSQNDAVVAANDVINKKYIELKQKGDPNAAYNAQQEWLKQYDPKVFEFNRMSEKDQAAFSKSLKQTDPAAYKAFGDKYNQFHANGWVQ